MFFTEEVEEYATAPKSDARILMVKFNEQMRTTLQTTERSGRC